MIVPPLSIWLLRIKLLNKGWLHGGWNEEQGDDLQARPNRVEERRKAVEKLCGSKLEFVLFGVGLQRTKVFSSVILEYCL